MKLTDRGRQFLKGTLAGAIVAAIVGINIVLALCLSLVIAALISEMMLVRYSSRSIELMPELSRVSCFKGENVRVRLIFKPNLSRFVNVSISKFSVREGVESMMEDSLPDGSNLVIKPKFAGRFSGLSVELEVNDLLGLFKKAVKSKVENFTLDCYPLSLLKETKTAMPVSISLGDREARSPGVGMEFHSVDEYNGSSEWKSIFWRKVASMPDERLLVKKRSANIQRSISIALVHTSNREQYWLGWIDEACEGASIIGKTILQIGCDVEIIYDAGGQIVSEIAANLEELSEALMKMSTSKDSDTNKISKLLTKADICITGFRELENEQLASALARKPTLLIEDVGATPAHLSELAIIYNPYADLVDLVRRVSGI